MCVKTTGGNVKKAGSDSKMGAAAEIQLRIDTL